MRMTIKTRLVAAFAMLITLLGVSSFMALHEASQLQAQFDEVADRTAVQLNDSLSMEATAARTMSLVEGYLAQSERETAAQIAGQVDQQIATVARKLESIRPLLNTGLAHGLLDDFEAQWGPFIEVEDELREFGLANSGVRAREMYYGTSAPAYLEANEKLEALIYSVRSRLAVDFHPEVTRVAA
ncbi:MCP four helix bundle domain-containing protein [Palleronia sp.]|uniref:MCP four helix bundle domain-containing protein n=1 Tax=Palleronia sp. TaxID=1940284 RepID=UPI0035C85A69